MNFKKYSIFLILILLFTGCLVKGIPLSNTNTIPINTAAPPKEIKPLSGVLKDEPFISKHLQKKNTAL